MSIKSCTFKTFRKKKKLRVVIRPIKRISLEILTILEKKPYACKFHFEKTFFC